MLEAVKLLGNDPEVQSIFVNIFGGILKCDVLAQSIMNAAREIKLSKPIVLRLKGTHSEEAKAMLRGKEKELGIYFEEDLDKAARKVVEVAKQ
jgi:succinyl-CoA synthetase beta subunit